MLIALGRCSSSYSSGGKTSTVLVCEQALHLLAIDRCRHQASVKMSPKTVRPSSLAAAIEIGKPLISSWSRR